MVFPECESWTIKTSECRRIGAFEPWCWRKTLESPLDSKEIQPVNPKGNQSWIFTGRTVKLQNFGHLMRRTDSFEKTLVLWKIEGGKRRRRQRWLQRWLHGITDLMDMNLSKFWESVMDREVWHAAIHGVTKSQTWLSDWTELSGRKPRLHWEQPVELPYVGARTLWLVMLWKSPASLIRHVSLNDVRPLGTKLWTLQRIGEKSVNLGSLGKWTTLHSMLSLLLEWKLG